MRGEKGLGLGLRLTPSGGGPIWIDPIIAHIYRTRLENEAYAVETCNDGRIGLDRVREFDPHAILLDIMLPPVNERWIAGA
ncbi:MAG TPA: hypothetical protein VNU68_21150 [Verrucomicrobiae bacterium]|nr:hypothetical protein [Verrucomicrobiae bacterium]